MNVGSGRRSLARAPRPPTCSLNTFVSLPGSERTRTFIPSESVPPPPASSLARSSPLFSIGVGHPGGRNCGITHQFSRTSGRGRARTGVVLRGGDGPAAVPWRRVQVSAIGYSGGAPPRDFVLVPRASGNDIRRFRRRRGATSCSPMRDGSVLLLPSPVAHERGSGSKRTTATERSSPSRRKPRLGMLFLLSLLRSSLASIVRCLVLPPSLPPSLAPSILFPSSSPPPLPYPMWIVDGPAEGKKERKKEGRMEGRRECATYVSCPLRSGKREGREEETQTD